MQIWRKNHGNTHIETERCLNSDQISQNGSTLIKNTLTLQWHGYYVISVIFLLSSYPTPLLSYLSSLSSVLSPGLNTLSWLSNKKMKCLLLVFTVLPAVSNDNNVNCKWWIRDQILVSKFSCNLHSSIYLKSNLLISCLVVMKHLNPGWTLGSTPLGCL